MYNIIVTYIDYHNIHIQLHNWQYCDNDIKFLNIDVLPHAYIWIKLCMYGVNGQNVMYFGPFTDVLW